MENQTVPPSTAPSSPTPPQPSPPKTITEPLSTPVKKDRNKLLIIFVLLFLAVSGVAGYFAYQNYQLKQQIVQKQSTPSPTVSVLSPTTLVPSPTGIQPTTKPATQPITVPSDWKQYTATDPDFGIKTTMFMPPGYSFRFTGSEFTIQNDSDATELWNYSTSIFRGKDGLKDYYTEESRRAWYQKLLNGEFMLEKPHQFIPGQITNVVEHQIGSKSYLELTASGGSPTNYSGEVGTHYIYVQNGIVHIIKPASHKANSAEALIPSYIGTIFISLNSSSTK